MEQLVIVNKFIKEIETVYLLTPEFRSMLKKYLMMTYCVGFDYGKKSTSLHSCKRVAKLNKFGEKEDEYESISHAALKNEVHVSSISAVANGLMPSVKGMFFKFIENGEDKDNSSSR